MGNKVAIFSTAYLPPIQYVKGLFECDLALIESFETYKKQTYRNRCIVLSANGPLALTIPIVKPYGNRTKTSEVLIDNSVKWRKEHWRAIESAYRSSAFFEYVMDSLFPFYEIKYESLIDYNTGILREVVNIIGFNTKIKHTDSFVKDYPPSIDFRYSISPKNGVAKTEAEFKPYFQVFREKFGFIPNLSILDLICNCGMDSWRYLQ